GYNGCLQSGVFNAFFQSVRGTDWSRSDNRQDGGLGGEPRNPHGNVVQAIRFVFGQENDWSFAGKGFDIGGISETARAHIATDDLFQILFEEWDIPLSHLNHACAVGVAAGNGSAKIRETGRNHCSQVARTVNSDLHVLS